MSYSSYIITRRMAAAINHFAGKEILVLDPKENLKERGIFYSKDQDQRVTRGAVGDGEIGVLSASYWDRGEGWVDCGRDSAAFCWPKNYEVFLRENIDLKADGTLTRKRTLQRATTPLGSIYTLSEIKNKTSGFGATWVKDSEPAWPFGGIATEKAVVIIGALFGFSEAGIDNPSRALVLQAESLRLAAGLVSPKPGEWPALWASVDADKNDNGSLSVSEVTQMTDEWAWAHAFWDGFAPEQDADADMPRLTATLSDAVAFSAELAVSKRVAALRLVHFQRDLRPKAAPYLTELARTDVNRFADDLASAFSYEIGNDVWACTELLNLLPELELNKTITAFETRHPGLASRVKELLPQCLKPCVVAPAVCP